MINVMIAEKSRNLNELFCSFLQRDKEIKVISRNYDGLSTLQNYRDLRPDVLLLNLDIPKLNGIEIIDSLCLDIKEKKKCNIVIITEDDNLKLRLINTSKIYKILSNPCNFDDLLNVIKEIR